MRIEVRTIVPVLIVLLVGTFLPPVTAAPQATRTLNIHNHIIYLPSSTTVPGSPPFAPSDIWKAYNYLPLYARGIKGNGTRIAIIDAYGDPSLSSDLSSFNSLTGLPSTTVNIYYPDGNPSPCNFPSCSWGLETALDVEWAHAVAPAATIDVIAGRDNSFQHLYHAIQYVANNLPQETTLSMSWGDYESAYSTINITRTHQLFTTITGHGTAIFASSGDAGAIGCCAVSYPASDPLVVGVGGTTLHLDSNASYVSEQAWSGSGAGDSIVYPKPAWQKGLGDPLFRVSVDVSYDADPNSGVQVLFQGGKYTVGGTSAGSPQWAALVALASQAGSQSYGDINPKLYTLSYHDVLNGSNGYFYAGPGWDYPTGLGTPDAYAIVTALSPPIPLTINGTQIFQGVSVTTNSTLSVAMFNGRLSGLVTVLARNSTTGTVLFDKSYNLTNLQLQSRGSTYSGSFLLNILATSLPLSANVQVREASGTATATFTVTRRIDVNGDGTVNILDLAFVADAFGATLNSPNYDARADIDASGAVNIIDLANVAAFYNAPDYI